METKEKLLAVFLGPLGINHFVRGCYKTGGLKALSSIAWIMTLTKESFAAVKIEIIKS